MKSFQTYDPEIAFVLEQLCSGAQTVLGDYFVGLYLYGSLASGDFNPLSSDIDFMILTADELPPDKIAALAVLHGRLSASGQKWARKLEGAYVPQRVIRRHDPVSAPCPTVNEGRFYRAGLGSDWVIQRHILREQGVVLAGPALPSLIDPVSPDNIIRAVQETLREWWAPMLAEPSRLHSREYQAYAVLTMCRALYTLRSGIIVSKPAAARWAQEWVEEGRAGLIENALAWPEGSQPDQFAETLEFLRFVLEKALG